MTQLRHELTQGIRLPNPQWCPEQISTLIKRCFLEDPNTRPDFKEIKSAIENAYGFLTAIVDPNENTNKEEGGSQYANVLPINNSTDDKMKERYLVMKRENKKRQTENTAGGPTDGTEGNAPSPNSIMQRGRYISLENVLTSASMIGLNGSQKNTPMPGISAPPNSAGYRPVSIKSNKYKKLPLSPGSNEIKSFFSFSAIDNIDHLQPPELNRKITQSWNPLYMLVQSALNLNSIQRTESRALTDIEGSGSVDSVAYLGPIIKEQAKRQTIDERNTCVQEDSI